MWVSKASSAPRKNDFFLLLLIFVTHRVYGSSNNKPSSTSKGMEKREEVRKKKKTSSSAFASSSSWSSIDLQRVSFSRNHYHWMGIDALVFVAFEHTSSRGDMKEAREEIEIRWLRLHRARAAKETGRVCTWRRPISLRCLCVLFADQND